MNGFQARHLGTNYDVREFPAVEAFAGTGVELVIPELFFSAWHGVSPVRASHFTGGFPPGSSSLRMIGMSSGASTPSRILPRSICVTVMQMSSPIQTLSPNFRLSTSILILLEIEFLSGFL